MNRYMLKSATLAGVVLAMCIAVGVSAGDLNPPPGPVTPTMKTLTEIEPRIAVNEANTPGDETCNFKITEPGSYVLPGNVTGVEGKHGILITTDGVTLDLNGFAVIGVPGSVDGVTASTNGNVSVRNGIVRNWGQNGVYVGSGSYIQGIRVSYNGGVGITVDHGCVVRDCTATGNGTGLTAGHGSVFTNCTASENVGDGFRMEDSVCEHCNSRRNGGVGFVVSQGSLVVDCLAETNAGDGIQLWGAVYIVRNACHKNGWNGDGAGIHITDFVQEGGGRIEGNNLSGNDRGIDVDYAGHLIIKNSAWSNGTNYDIVEGNSYGPIINVAGLGDISTVPGSEHPWANFEF